MATNNAINLSSAGVITYDGAGTFSASTLTQNAVLVGGASNAISSQVLTDGQLVIGSTGNAPVAAQLTEGTGIAITSTSGSITISSVGGGFDWNIVTAASQTMVAHNAYVANNTGVVTLTLPATSAVGDTIQVAGMNSSGSWKIAQPNPATQIFFGSAQTTLGTGGYLQSTATYDNVTLTCISANATWIVTTSIGNITVN
jgi:hypothetical protein